MFILTYVLTTIMSVITGNILTRILVSYQSYGTISGGRN